MGDETAEGGVGVAVGGGAVVAIAHRSCGK